MHNKRLGDTICRSWFANPATSVNPVDHKIREGAFKAKFPKVMSSPAEPLRSVYLTFVMI